MPKSIYKLATMQSQDEDEWIWPLWLIVLEALVLICLFVVAVILNSIPFAIGVIAIGAILKFDAYGFSWRKSWFLTSLRKKRRVQRESEAALQTLHQTARKNQKGIQGE